MRIAMIASECEPYAKTGGLADVVDALSRALGQAGHEVDVYLPRYRGLDPPAVGDALELEVPTGLGRGERVTLWTGQGRGYRLRLVDHPPSFDRPDYYVIESGGRSTIPTTASASRCSDATAHRGHAGRGPAGRRHSRPRLGGRAGAAADAHCAMPPNGCWRGRRRC